MIECIFTLDYEIYGNGSGDLASLVFQPTERLLTLFRSRGKRLVLFVEAAELAAIQAARSDPAIAAVTGQLRRAYDDGFEIALHLHPQWCNARWHDGCWQLDYSEYNLCTLPRARMTEIVDRAIDYLRRTVADSRYTPASFRAGNWLFQPTATLARVLADRGIRIDSSVYKGGLQREQGLDYREAVGNGYAWRFTDDVSRPDPDGVLLEIPTYTELVPPWSMITGKRLGLVRQRGDALRGRQIHERHRGERGPRMHNALDLARWRYPLKLDFCRMTLRELLRMIDGVRRADDAEPSVLRPLVAIGHTKDLVDHDTVERFLDALLERGISVSLLTDVYPKFGAVLPKSAVSGAMP